MGFDLKLVQNAGQIDPQKLKFGAFVGCFLVSLTYLSMSNPYPTPIPTVNSDFSSIHAAVTGPLLENNTSSRQLDCNGARENGTQEINPRCNVSSPGSDFGGKVDVNTMPKNSSENDRKKLESNSKMKKSMISDDPISVRYGMDGDNGVAENSSAKVIDSTERLDSRDSNQLEINNKTEKSLISDDPKSVRYDMVPKDSPTKTIDSTQILEARDSKQLDVRSEEVKPERKPMCDLSDFRADVCEMNGDIRIIGKYSSVIFVTSSQMGNSERKESWRIRPYARKSDNTAMSNVREVFLKSSDSNEEPPRCAVNHSIPAIVFSDAGFTGNYFHDFTDVLVPLFQTSRQFNGEVQFLVTNYRYWWIHKYLPIFQLLSRYEIIDFDNEDHVHCFPHAIVGLRSDRDLNIDPSRSPNGYTMAEFTKFMRSAYSLERESPLRIIGKIPSRRKPRLLIIARSWTRRFTNLDKIVRMAKKLGYEVVVAENDGRTDVAKFAHMVNSCDVMMGVHGAGLTNLVFLPTNAILIQIVPWGGLDWIANNYFNYPAKEMKLRYLEYRISEDESTLRELYPRDHPVFKDPMSIHKLGWNAMGDIYLVKQNVKLNVKRFKVLLSKALKMLHQ